jgi:exosortase family protein XrtM
MIPNNSSDKDLFSSVADRRNASWIAFAGWFFMGFASLQAGYSYCLAEPLKIALVKLFTLNPSAVLINLFTPHEQVLVKHQLLLSPYAGLAVQKGCEGMEGVFLLCAAIAAFRTTLRQKLMGALAGLVIIMALNVSRLVSLYYVLRFEKMAFGLLHGYLWPGVIVLGGALYFLWWAERQEGIA